MPGRRERCLSRGDIVRGTATGKINRIFARFNYPRRHGRICALPRNADGRRGAAAAAPGGQAGGAHMPSVRPAGDIFIPFFIHPVFILLFILLFILPRALHAAKARPALQRAETTDARRRYFSRSASVFELRKFMMTSSSSRHSGMVRQPSALSQGVSEHRQETGAREPSAAVIISATE